MKLLLVVLATLCLAVNDVMLQKGLSSILSRPLSLNNALVNRAGMPGGALIRSPIGGTNNRPILNGPRRSAIGPVGPVQTIYHYYPSWMHSQNETQLHEKEKKLEEREKLLEKREKALEKRERELMLKKPCKGSRPVSLNNQVTIKAATTEKMETETLKMPNQSDIFVTGKDAA